MRLLGLASLLLFTLLCQSTFAQKQNNQWRFGNSGAIDFNTLPPSFVNGCVIAATEGSASVADRVTGALLFYTDGVTVWNANNQIMPNGTGLLGGVTLSSTTAAVIVPKPGSSNLYYIITVDEFTSNNGVRYSVVDMTQNGGLGDIVAGQKNIFLFQTNEERLEVVPASDGQSYWLLTHNNTNSSFYSFRINNAGIQNTPVVSTVGSAFQINQGHIKINKQFNKVAMGISYVSDIELFDFDNTTGVLSNPITLNFNLPSNAYGIEFSPDGKMLYFSDGYSIFQLDLTQTTALAIQNSAYQVGTVGGVLQLGIDEKIYVASTLEIDVINCPNNLGAACGYQTNVIATGPSWGGSSSLPKWVYYASDHPSITANLILASDSCLGTTTQFSLLSTNGVANVSWNFGDPLSGANNTATGLTASHAYGQAGNYTVTAVITNTCGIETLTLPTYSIINCNGAAGITGIKIAGDTCAMPATLSLQAVGTSNSPYFFWNFGDPASGTNDTITITGSSASAFPTHTFSAPGVYTVCVKFQEPGFAVKTVCRTISIGLCCQGIIASIDTCLEYEIPFSVLANASILSINWDFDDPASGANNFANTITTKHKFSSSGSYTIRTIVTYNCGIDTLSKTIRVNPCENTIEECGVYVPKAFTPNGDGLNDQFGALSSCSFENYNLQIFNRWGEAVFQTSNPSDKWDGQQKGKDCNIGAYVYLITYKLPSQEPKVLYGSITLLR
jgi:gliding motility-associated-like protein